VQRRRRVPRSWASGRRLSSRHDPGTSESQLSECVGAEGIGSSSPGRDAAPPASCRRLASASAAPPVPGSRGLAGAARGRLPIPSALLGRRLCRTHRSQGFQQMRGDPHSVALPQHRFRVVFPLRVFLRLDQRVGGSAAAASAMARFSTGMRMLRAIALRTDAAIAVRQAPNISGPEISSSTTAM